MVRVFALALTIFMLAAAPAGALAPARDDEEIRLGQRYSAELERKHRLVADAATTARVWRIGREVAAFAGGPRFAYDFRVFDLDYPTAVALPGGIVYVTRGMLQFVRTDHELAAVLANEVAHAVRRHTMQMLRRHGQAQFMTMVSGIVIGKVDVVLGARSPSITYLSAYSREMEKEADLLAVAMLRRTRYTPVALLTLLERIAREELLSAPSDPGVFRDHPRPSERVTYVEAELKRLGIPFNRRPALGYLQISVRAVSLRGREIGELMVDRQPVLRLPAIQGRAVDRMQIIAARLDRLFNDDVMPFEISAREIQGGWGVFVRQILIVTLTPVDAAFAGKTPQALAQEARGRLMWAIQQSARLRRF